jgi:hypothetical protein
MLDWRGVTNEEALAAWDKGDSIWSASMGGLGPGYEQCIQLMGFEMLRAILENPPKDWKEFDDAETGLDKWRDYCKGIESKPKVAHVVKTLRVSGAQYGAAMNLATVLARNGYSEGLEKVDKDRLIQVMRTFPTLE